ncbi:radical SAM protein [Candidatus Woesearchaeota archaeon]|nr:radical SAM protein [Candidatus Woesearchaeota archaeon]
MVARISIQKTPYFSWRCGKLAEGCRLCVKGQKLVLFVTGLCPRDCWYCPLAETKKNKDTVWADEWKVGSEDDAVREAELIDAKGASLTGGDPFCRLDRSVSLVKLLKKRFGKEFHIHMYAPMELLTSARLSKLHKAGVDEIRLHPDLYSKKGWEKIKLVTRFEWDIGVEIPVIPGMKQLYLKLIRSFKDSISFLNLNELEISDTNMDEMLKRGFRTKDELSYAVRGSQELAFELMRHCRKHAPGLKVHYCTTKLKDKVQLANRIKRRARNVKKKFDIITDEGMLYRGSVYLERPGVGYRRKLERLGEKKRHELLNNLVLLRKRIIKKHCVPAELIVVDRKKLRLLTSVPVAEELAEELKQKGLAPALVEEYPTWDQMELSVEFL